MYLCSGAGGSRSPITSLHAVTTPAANTGACAAGYEQLAGNMNTGSKSKGYIYLCISRKNGTAITVLTGEKASTGCAGGSKSVEGVDGKVFNFDTAGVGVVLCSQGASHGDDCPLPPPAQPAHPITEVTAVISSIAGACCPLGFERLAAGGNSSAMTAWDSDLNTGAGGNFVYLCSSKSPPPSPAVGWISDLVAFATHSAADPFEPCPAGYTKMGNSTSGDLNSGSKNPGVAYLCYKKADAASKTKGIGGLLAVIGNASVCPSGMQAVPGTAAKPGPFDFDPAGPGLHVCFSSLSAP